MKRKSGFYNSQKPRRKFLFRQAGSKMCRLRAGTEKSNKIFLRDLRELGGGR